MPGNRSRRNIVQFADPHEAELIWPGKTSEVTSERERPLRKPVAMPERSAIHFCTLKLQQIERLTVRCKTERLRKSIGTGRHRVPIFPTLGDCSLLISKNRRFRPTSE